MSYTVKSVNGCTKKLEFNFATLDLTKEIKAAVVRKQSTTNMKGFRKGKAPLSMVEQVYGPQIESDALNQFVQTQLFEAVTKEQLKTVGYPTFENVKYDSGKSVSFDAVVEVFPEIATLSDLQLDPVPFVTTFLIKFCIFKTVLSEHILGFKTLFEYTLLAPSLFLTSAKNKGFTILPLLAIAL